MAVYILEEAVCLLGKALRTSICIKTEFQPRFGVFLSTVLYRHKVHCATFMNQVVEDILYFNFKSIHPNPRN